MCRYRGHRDRIRRERSGKSYDLEKQTREVNFIQKKLNQVQDTDVKKSIDGSKLAIKWGRDRLSSARDRISERISERASCRRDSASSERASSRPSILQRAKSLDPGSFARASRESSHRGRPWTLQRTGSRGTASFRESVRRSAGSTRCSDDPTDAPSEALASEPPTDARCQSIRRIDGSGWSRDLVSAGHSARAIMGLERSPCNPLCGRTPPRIMPMNRNMRQTPPHPPAYNTVHQTPLEVVDMSPMGNLSAGLASPASTPRPADAEERTQGMEPNTRGVEALRRNSRAKRQLSTSMDKAMDESTTEPSNPLAPESPPSSPPDSERGGFAGPADVPWRLGPIGSPIRISPPDARPDTPDGTAIQATVDINPAAERDETSFDETVDEVLMARQRQRDRRCTVS